MNWGQAPKSIEGLLQRQDLRFDFDSSPQFIHTFIDRAYKGSIQTESNSETRQLSVFQFRAARCSWAGNLRIGPMHLRTYELDKRDVYRRRARRISTIPYEGQTERYK